MAIYRQIQTTYWQDKFILTLTPEEKFFYIYLLTNSKTKQCGIYELPIKIIEVETGYNRETVVKLLQRFIEHGRIRFDWENEEVALKNWVKHNNYENNPKIQKCVEKELKDIKNETFLDFMGFSDTLCKGYHNKNKKKNKNKNKNNGFIPPSLDEAKAYISSNIYNVEAERFINFYSSKGWMVGKNKMKDWQAAIRGWQTRNNDENKKETPKSFNTDPLAGVK